MLCITIICNDTPVGRRGSNGQVRMLHLPQAVHERSSAGQPTLRARLAAAAWRVVSTGTADMGSKEAPHIQYIEWLEIHGRPVLCEQCSYHVSQSTQIGRSSHSLRLKCSRQGICMMPIKGHTFTSQDLCLEGTSRQSVALVEQT